MYSWGGTLTTPGMAHNRAIGREREHPKLPAQQSSFPLSFLEWPV